MTLTGPRKQHANRIAASRSRGGSSRVSRWGTDVAIGLRLALGGGRTSRANIVRLVLGTIGIGASVALLLLAAAVPTINDGQSDRQDARHPVPAEQAEATASDAALHLRVNSTRFDGEAVTGRYLEVTGNEPAHPPGVSELPEAGEIVVSPALAELLDSPEGSLLEPRVPEEVVGTISPAGLSHPDELFYYAGGDSLAAEGTPVIGWGGTGPGTSVSNTLVVLIIVGTVVLLAPLLIFIATSSRIAGAERDRIMAALRLVGADARRVRRIAAAETLLTALAGLALGVTLFQLARHGAQYTGIEVLTAYPADITPAWPPAVAIIMVTPVLAIASSLLGLRRVMAEPLGVLRRSKTVRRRLTWRLILPLCGIGLLVFAPAAPDAHTDTALACGTAAILLGLPLLMPWLVERVLTRAGGGSPAWQLAVRRLQLDSATPAKVVGGVMVVLAGTLAVNIVLASITHGMEQHAGAAEQSSAGEAIVRVHLQAAHLDEATRLLHETPAVTDVESRQAQADSPAGSQDEYATVQAAADVRTAEETEHLRNALAPLRWRANTTVHGPESTSRADSQLATIRTTLYTGSGVIMLLAGGSLVALATVQVTERRRVLAMLDATGVPRGVLARSVLWQNAIPIGLGSLMAMGTGLVLATLVLRIVELPLVLNWVTFAALTVAAIALTLLVTACTVPALRSAMRLDSLRTE